MKKPFRANSRLNRFSYLYANPVHTPRLKIAFVQPNDLPAYRDYVLRDDLGYYQFLKQGWEEETVETLTPDYVRYLMDHVRATRWASLDLGVKRKGAPNEIIGTINLYPDSEGRPWLGYYFSKCARGQGYAREAVSAVLNTIQKYEHRTVERFETSPDNMGSRKLIAKLGYECVGKVPSMAGARKGEVSLRFIL